MRTIAIINLKGGVAKTTSSINIAYILMRKGYKVLLVDNDKQGDCSRGMNRRTQDGEGIDRIMVDRHPDMEKLINKTDYLHLDIITANLGLLTANMEVTMDRVRPQQNRLRKALQQVADNYDFCVIDNAPDINVSVINALTAADDVLIPVEVDDNTLEGMNELLDQIDDVKEELNPDLENVRCFVTKYQKFNQAHLQGAEIIEEQYPIMRTSCSRKSSRSMKRKRKNDSGRNIWNSEENITQHLTAGYSHNVPADFYRREVRPWVIHFIKWRSKSRVILLA